MSERGTCQTCHHRDSWQKSPPLPSGTLSSSQTGLMGSYITVHAHTEVLTRQAPNSMRTKGGETLSLTLMDKERVFFCVQTFNRVTEGPVVLEICRGKVESREVVCAGET